MSTRRVHLVVLLLSSSCASLVAACGSDEQTRGAPLVIPDRAPVIADAPELDPRSGLVSPKRSVLVMFGAEAGSAELARVLDASGAELGGGAPSVRLVQLILPDGTTFEARDAIIQDLSLLPGVVAVSADYLLDPLLLPERATEQATPAWDWKSGCAPGFEGNWGLKSIGAPVAWNLVPWLRRHGSTPSVGVIDHEFAQHPDLSGTFTLDDGAFTQTNAHGTAVAGVIGARWDNGLYADGVTPSADVHGIVVGRVSGTISWARLWSTDSAPRVVNVSLGFQWMKRLPSGRRCDPRPSHPPGDDECDPTVAMAAVTTSGRLVGALVQETNRMRSTLVVVAAGNNSLPRPDGFGPFPSALSSPFTWAAINTDAKANMIVVEASQQAGGGSTWDTVRAASSDIDGGGVFAPGSGIGVLGFDGSLWTVEQRNGTSYAAPLVAGAAAYLLAIEPRLTNAELKTLLTAPPYARPMNGRESKTATALDMVGATFGIDDLGHMRDRPLGAILVDIDDGTPDGFRRAERDDNGEIVRIVEDDARGDGKVDLRDFRRLRDNYLMAANHSTLGDPSSKKLDLNLDGKVDPPEDEFFPRASFDADGQVSLYDAYFMGVIGIDTDVLARWFEPDPVQPWSKDDLGGLLASADLLVRPAAAITSLGAEAILIDDITGTADIDPPHDTGLHNLRVDGREVVLTTPKIHGVTIHWRPICNGEPQDPKVEVRIGELEEGEDRVLVLDPSAHDRCCPPGDTCAPPVVRHTCSSTVAPNVDPRIYHVHFAYTLEDGTTGDTDQTYTMTEECTVDGCVERWTLRTISTIGGGMPNDSTVSFTPSSFQADEVIMVHGDPICTDTGVVCIPDGSTCVETRMNSVVERSCINCGDQGPACVGFTWTGAECRMTGNTWIPCASWDTECGL